MRGCVNPVAQRGEGRARRPYGRLAQTALAGGKGNRIGCEEVALVLGETTQASARIGRRIVGLPDAAPRRDGRKAPAFDGCGEDL